MDKAALVTIRIGVPSTGGALVNAAKDAGYPILLSANAFRRNGKFLKPSDTLKSMDVALDSAGFVAMRLYGGYPWTEEEYLDLVASGAWTWWASMDYCCEPEVADDEAEVQRRVVKTATRLCRLTRAALDRGMKPPMPILQGWKPQNYIASIGLTTTVLGALPNLVGVGSVCRRKLRGPEGLAAIITALHEVLPERVKLHLFGVKSTTLTALLGIAPGRITSTDSMAWDFRARMDCRTRQVPFANADRIRHMHMWRDAQVARLGTLG